MNFRLTTHAIRRYQQRFDRCERREAIDRLRHAAEISRLATARETHAITTRKGGRRRGKSSGLLYLICPVEPIVLACRRTPTCILVVTVYRLHQQAAA